jgi:hypothetical protein
MSRRTLKFRNLTGQFYDLEVDEESTIRDVKAQLESEKGIPKESTRLILSAKVLNDDQVVKDINWPANAIIVIHANRARPPAAAAPAPSPAAPPASDPSGAPPASSPAPPPASAPPASAPPAQAPPPSFAAPSQPASSGGAGPSGSGDPPNFQALVTGLIELGFEKAQVEQALRVSSYNPDGAANMLLSGDIPAAGAGGGGGGFGGGGHGGGYGGGGGGYGGGGGGDGYGGGGGGGGGFDAGKYGQLQSVYDGLSAAEKAAVDRLSERAGDPATAIQIFVACDKDEASARNLLG